MITAETIDLIRDFLLCASDCVMEQGFESKAEQLRQIVVSPRPLPDWAVALVNEFRDNHGIDLQWSGSRFISPGAVAYDTDWDFFGLASNRFIDNPPSEWESNSDYPDYMHCFRGYPHGHNVNLILFSPTAEDMRYRFEVATNFCAALRVTQKAMRIAIFQLVLYGNVELISEITNA